MNSIFSLGVLFSVSGTHEVGTVGSLRKVKDAVMDYTDHTLIDWVSGECFFMLTTK